MLHKNAGLHKVSVEAGETKNRGIEFSVEVVIFHDIAHFFVFPI